MNQAQDIMYNLRFPEDSVKIDYVTFTFAMKDLRHCHGAAGHSKLKVDSEGKPKRKLLQRHATAPSFPAPPEFNATLVRNTEDLSSYQHAFLICTQEYLTRCLEIFTQSVLGLNLSVPRGKGFQFYEDSMVLTSASGNDFCGFVGFGGNNDTVHFQINGVGCKHMFSHLAPWALHDWLSNVLGVQKLSRVDLAYDDHDGLFDCDYAYKAWLDDAFRTADRGRGPSIAPAHQIEKMVGGKPIYSKEQYSIGSRQSRVYWRIYNKKLEQKILAEDFIWYRSEVELKKWDIDVLLDPNGAFAAINDFSASMSKSKPFNTKPKKTKVVALDLLSRAHWMRKQYGKTLTALLKHFDGDMTATFGLLQRDESAFTFPPTYQKLTEHILET